MTDSNSYISEQSTVNSTRSKQQQELNKQTAETKSLVDKRAIIKQQLKTNVPMKTAFLFGMLQVIIGLAAVELQIALIVYTAINYQIGNGIWAGFIVMLNGVIKLNIGKRKRIKLIRNFYEF